MIQAIPAAEVTLRTLKQTLDLQAATHAQFFSEWQGEMEPIDERDRQALDRVKDNYLDLLEDPPVLENSVKMVVLGPLLDLAGFYRRPFRITTETSIDIELEDEQTVIRGRIDVLVLNETLGTEFMFLKAQRQPTAQYATSRLFSLFNPGNELYQVLSILKQLAEF